MNKFRNKKYSFKKTKKPKKYKKKMRLPRSKYREKLGIGRRDWRLEYKNEYGSDVLHG